MARQRRTYSQNHRDMVRLRNLAQEVIRQVGFFQSNTERAYDDTMRFLLIEGDILKMQRCAARAVRRWHRLRAESK